MSRTTKSRFARLSVQSLEAREVPSTVTLDAPSKTVTIDGSEAEDRATVKLVSGKVEVALRHRPAGPDMPWVTDAVKSYTTSQVTKVLFFGHGWQDTFTNETAVPASADGGAGDDQLTGGTGNDTLIGGTGNDNLAGGAGNDRLTGDDGNDVLKGESGNDFAEGGYGDDSVYGGSGNDTLYGSGGHDVVKGESGNDDVRGHGGNDTVEGGTGADTVDGGSGNDVLRGDADNDKLYGTTGNDTLYGGTGNDRLDGGDNDDRLFGEAGTDWLYGGTGNDWLEAGSAAEYANFGGGSDFNAHKWAQGGTAKEDIRQGQLGTCVFLSGLASAAHTGMDLTDRITYLGNYTYRVQLYIPGTSLFVPIDVGFNGTYLRAAGGMAEWYDPTANPTGRYNDPAQNQAGEFWTLLYQRAYLQYMHVIDADFKAPENAMGTITGRAVLDLDEDASTAPRTLKTLLAAGMTATAGNADATAVTVANHSYSVLAVAFETANGKWWVTLRNPWGQDGPQVQGADDGILKMCWSDFVDTNDFDRVTVS